MALSKITAGSIADGTVVAADIADGSITGPKLGATAINANNIVDGTITNAKIDTVANTKISGNITNDQILSVANTKITGNITSSQIAPSQTFYGNTSLTGLLDLSATNAGLIKFPASQNASSDANTLDDYEEGTYTATLTSAGGSITTSTSEDTAYYIKIGRLVMVTGRITASSVNSPTGEVSINLPFTIANDTEQATALAGSVFVWSAGGGATETGLWTLFSDKSNPSILFRYGNSATPAASASYVQANTEFRFTVIFVAA
jgi:hypothetical protein